MSSVASLLVFALVLAAYLVSCAVGQDYVTYPGPMSYQAWADPACSVPFDHPNLALTGLISNQSGCLPAHGPATTLSNITYVQSECTVDPGSNATSITVQYWTAQPGTFDFYQSCPWNYINQSSVIVPSGLGARDFGVPHSNTSCIKASYYTPSLPSLIDLYVTFACNLSDLIGTIPKPKSNAASRASSTTTAFIVTAVALLATASSIAPMRATVLLGIVMLLIVVSNFNTAAAADPSTPSCQYHQTQAVGVDLGGPFSDYTALAPGSTCPLIKQIQYCLNPTVNLIGGFITTYSTNPSSSAPPVGTVTGCSLTTFIIPSNITSVNVRYRNTGNSDAQGITYLNFTFANGSPPKGFGFYTNTDPNLTIQPSTPATYLSFWYGLAGAVVDQLGLYEVIVSTN